MPNIDEKYFSRALAILLGFSKYLYNKLETSCLCNGKLQDNFFKLQKWKKPFFKVSLVYGENYLSWTEFQNPPQIIQVFWSF